MTWSIANNIVHSNSGGVATTGTSTAITVSLAGADTTEDGNMVVVVLGGYKDPAASGGFIFTTPSGWVMVNNAASESCGVFYRGPNEGLATGESSWNFTPSNLPGGGSTGPELTWQVYEFSSIQAVEPVEVGFTGSLDAGTGTVKSSTSGRTGSYDAVVLAAHKFSDVDNATPATWGSHSNSFTEIGESGQAGTGNSVALSVSARSVQTISTYAVAATLSRTWAANEAYSGTCALTVQGAPKQTDMVQLDGAESYQLGTITGNVTVDATAARSGARGYLLNSTAAACSKALPNAGATSAGSYPAWRFHIRLPDLTDRAQIFYFSVQATGGTATCTGRLTGGQIGLNWSGATSGGEQLSQTVTADQWIGIEIRIDYRSRPASLKADWAIDYNAELTDTTPAVLQTPATATSAPTGTFISVSSARVGWTSALTTSMEVDDFGQTPGFNFPIGDLRVLPLPVDAAGTPTVTGSTANFGVMTSNGTVAAWNATNARNAVDDIPPIAAGNGSRDAAVCIVAHATDTANFPMETYDLAANKVNVRGVKAHWWLWAASTTATTIRIFVSDGTDVHTMFAEANPSAGPTTQVYSSAVVRASATTPPNWTQAKVDNLEFRIGSNDANPDIGCDAFLLELAVVKAIPETLFGEAGEPIYVEAHRDPVTYALVGATVNNNSGEAVELTWEVDGVPDSSGSIPDGTAGQYVPMSADGTIETVGRVNLIPG